MPFTSERVPGRGSKKFWVFRREASSEASGAMLTTLDPKPGPRRRPDPWGLVGASTSSPGETGAGKSRGRRALNLVLGQRADRSLLRSGADACTVEAVFEVAGVRAPLDAFLADNGLRRVLEGQLILSAPSRRLAPLNSSSMDPRRWIASATLGTGWWISTDPDHQSLLQPARQLAILDALAAWRAGGRAWEAVPGAVRGGSGATGSRGGRAHLRGSWTCCGFRSPARLGSPAATVGETELESEHRRAVQCGPDPRSHRHGPGSTRWGGVRP